MVDIFVFKFRQKFEIITRIEMYFSLFYIFGFEGYKEVNQFWKSLAFFTFVISFLSILYYLYFVIDFKKKEKEYTIDYDIKNIEYTWNDKEYKKGKICKIKNFSKEHFSKIENKEEGLQIETILFDRKEEYKIYDFLKEKNYKIKKKEYMYKNFFKRWFSCAKDIRHTIKNN